VPRPSKPIANPVRTVGTSDTRRIGSLFIPKIGREKSELSFRQEAFKARAFHQ